MRTEDKSKVFFTSDLHFNLPHIIELDNRPFKTLKEHNDTLIRNWNSKVSKEDTVYIIGDIFYGIYYEDRYGKNQGIDEIMPRLNGHKVLILGNHDDCLSCRQMELYFDEVHQYLDRTIGGRRFIMNHFPLADWNAKMVGAIHLYAHLHNHNAKAQDFELSLGNSYNVGAPVNNYEPCTYEELIENKGDGYLIYTGAKCFYKEEDKVS